jgi:hypothetical protein
MTYLSYVLTRNPDSCSVCVLFFSFVSMSHYELAVNIQVIELSLRGMCSKPGHQILVVRLYLQDFFVSQVATFISSMQRFQAIEVHSCCHCDFKHVGFSH